jgi:GntR family transcriptional repressor for pyruvate dehydrogenase complex
MKSQPLSSQLADKLAETILKSDKYLPGQKLPTERELAEQMGASRTSIREASKQLEARGLVEIRRGAGTFVTMNPGVIRDPLGVDDSVTSTSDVIAVLEDWYRVRMILEGESMVLVAAAATEEELEQINALMKAENSRAGLVDPDFIYADQSFHCALAKASHNIIMERLIPTLHAGVYYDMVKGLYSRLRPRFNKNASENHELIVRHLLERDGTGAKLAMRYHMLVAIDDVRSLSTEP